MNERKKYQNTIRSLFPVYGPYEKRFFEDLKSSIAEYTQSFEYVRFSDLEKEFGTPTNIMSEYISNLKPEYLRKQLLRSKHIRIMCISITVIFIIFLIIGKVYFHKAYLKFQETIPAVKETSIQYHD
ncbi:DUF6120 family protein [Lachnospiraceae bacterium ZAX-1]